MYEKKYKISKNFDIFHEYIHSTTIFFHNNEQLMLKIYVDTYFLMFFKFLLNIFSTGPSGFKTKSRLVLKRSRSSIYTQKFPIPYIC